MNFQMFNLDLEKAEEPEIKLPTSVGIIEKAREFQKNIYFCFIDYAKALTVCGSQQTVENSSRDGNTRPPDLSPDKSMQVKNQQFEWDMEQKTCPKLGKEYIKAVYCHSSYLTYMQSTLCNMLGWMKHSWTQDCWEKYH